MKAGRTLELRVTARVGEPTASQCEAWAYRLPVFQAAVSRTLV